MWKIIGYVGAGLVILVLTIGIGIKITQKAEGYKAQQQYFYSFEPHFFIGGCARYNAVKNGDIPAQKPTTLKAKVKK